MNNSAPPRRGHNGQLHASVASDHWLVGGGEMGELIRSMDWAATPLGPLEKWPHSLRTTINLCLASNFPINILWGSGSNQIYNDGYRVLVGEKHPAGMGMGYQECWASAWPEIGPPFERAWAGETSFLENKRMFLTRSGYLEETFFTFSLSPIRDEHGEIAGLFHPVTETTVTMLSERRTRALRELAANTSEARSLETAFALIAQTLAKHELDLPFVLLYALNEAQNEARLVNAIGIEPGLAASPTLMLLTDESLAEDGTRWPLKDLLTDGSIMEVDRLKARFGSFDCGPYPEGANTALAQALFLPGTGQPAGVMIAGISPRLQFNEDYRNHIEQLTAAASTALSNALAYEQEKKRAEALAELDRAKTQFFANISHEFRTPLTLMLGPLDDLLANAAEFPAHLRSQLEMAHRNSRRLLKLVNSLLDFSRIEAGRVKATYQPTDLSAITAHLASNFRSAFERAGVKFSVDCPPLPQPVYVDRDMWEKIVLNLLSNAFKFTFTGEVTVLLQPAPGYAELIISDTGIGISSQELPHVFERFHRVEKARGRTHEGTGIGLALVQELVRLHQGTVEVQSVHSQGTSLIVRLPFGHSHLPAEQIGNSPELASTPVRAEAFVDEAWSWLPTEGEPRTSKETAFRGTRTQASSTVQDEGASETVLVVDDNSDMRDYLRRLLSGHFHVLTAANGEDALTMTLARQPDLILADIMMPSLDGLALLEAVRNQEQTKTTPLIFLSAQAGEEARSEGMARGADDYLPKPFSARELLARVGAHLKLARVRKDAEEVLRRSNEQLDRQVTSRTFELQEVDAALRDSERRLRVLINASSDALYLMSPDWSEMRQLGSGRFLANTGEPSLSWMDKYIVPEDQPKIRRVIQQALETKSTFELEHRVRRKDGSMGWTSSRAVPLFNEEGQISEWFGAASDITARKEAEQALQQSLAEKDSLLKEVHHRVKNNLQVITSLLEMQAHQTDNATSYMLFDEARNRVAAISAIHELLYRSGNFGKVQLNSYARELATYLVTFYEMEKRIGISVRGDDVQVELERAVSFGLLLNELISNVCKHAFPGNSTGELRVLLSENADKICLEVSDNGVGITGAMDQLTPSHLGLQLVQVLTQQLAGEIDIKSGGGTCIEVCFPRASPRTARADDYARELLI